MTDLRDQLQATLGGAYTLERELGGGGMSRVFLADEARLRRKVVVKVLSPELFEGLSAERFEREIQLAASLQQANIVPVLAAGDAGGVPYYTMPFVDGESLRARLARGPMPIAEALSILRDVARALAYAHERGIVHRDIKPDNVLLSRGTAVVTDFGIAKAIAASQMRSGAPTLTMTGVAIGTPAYMAPEQAGGDPDIDQRADIYSFGCMAYEILTGTPPFGGRAPHQMLLAHLAETPRPVTESRPDTPPELAKLVTACLEKEPAARPQSADELLASLESIRSGSTVRPDASALMLAQPGMLARALGFYGVAFVFVAFAAKLAITGIGLPDWVFPGALIVMALGLPVILFTAYTQYLARRAILNSPTLTPGGSAVATRGTMAAIALKASPHMSWRRAGIGGIAAIAFFAAVVAAFMVLRAFGIGPAASLFAAGRLNARDLLIVTDFRVKGIDSSLGAVISEAVRTELGQSRVLSIMSPTAVAASLQRMQRPPTTLLDLALARDVGQREGAKAVVDGDVTPLGAGFVVSLRLVTADSGSELAAFHGTAAGPTDLLPTIDKLTRDLRGKIGESLKSVRADPPLEQVTTGSLEALRRFAEGRRAGNLEGDAERAARLFQEAIALDSTFAMAYRSLGLVYGNMNDPPEKVDSAFAMAYRYRDRLTERERYLAESDFFGGPGHDRGRQIAASEAYLRVYPHDYAVLNNLGQAYDSRRSFARAESLYRRSLEENSGALVAYMNLATNLLLQGRVDAADTVRNAFNARFSPQGPVGPALNTFVAAARSTIDSTIARAQQARQTVRQPLGRIRFTASVSALLLTTGRIKESEELRAEVRSAFAARGGDSSPLDNAVDRAEVQAWFYEQPARATSILDSALAHTDIRALSISQRRYFDIARAYALAARPDRARAMLAAFDAGVKDTTLRRAMQPQVHRAMSEIAIAEHRPRDAVEEIRQSDRLPDGPADDCARCTYAALARAFDLAGMADSAIATFEQYLATPYWLPGERRADPTHLAGTYKRLGELYEARGDREKAASYYLKFVTLWKNADPELQPRVAEVRRRLARLSDVERR